MTREAAAREMMGTSRFLITSAPGLQGILAEELGSLGLEPVVEPSGAVSLSGGWTEASRVLLRSRVGSRVFLSLRQFAARTQAMLYDQVRRIDWPAVFASTRTISVEATGSVQGADFVLSFAPLKIKDAICDEFRKRGHPRPDVDRGNPDVRLRAFFHNGRCELSVDLCGDPLHKRGYRKEGALAPLRENRAAALLLFSGYDGSRPLVDPFCGSGTLAIEAALMATRTAPGLFREASAFALAKLFPDAEEAFREERDRALGERLEAPKHAITGSDLNPDVLDTARANAVLARVGSWIEFREADARSLEIRDAWIVTNPPYGERLEDAEGAEQLLRAFARQVKHHCVGSRLGLVVPQGGLEKAVGLRPEKRLAVESGLLRLRYLCFDIQSGRFHRDRSGA